MPKHVPALERAIRIINAMAIQPEETFSLTELAQKTDVNLSTCHAIVMSLHDNGFVWRHEPSKTYSLGPALVELGAAAAQQYLGLGVAREACAALAREFDLSCVVGALAGDEIVVIARSGGSPDVTTTTGTRTPMVPPMGAVFMAWSPETRVDAWLRNLGPLATADDVERNRKLLEDIRDRGFLVSLDATIAELTMVMAERIAAATTVKARTQAATDLAEMLRRESRFPAQLSNTTVHKQDHIAAPVFGPDGSVALTMSLIGSPGDLPRGQVDRIARRLLRACDDVADAINASSPHYGRASRGRARAT